MARATLARILPTGWQRTRPWAVAVVATLAMSVSYLDRQTLAAIGPRVEEGLHISHEQFGWLASAFAFAYLTFAPIAGRLVDRFGARRVLIVSVLCWSFVAAMHSMATSFGTLVVLRVLLGTTEAPSFPAAVQTIRRTLPAHRRSTGFGMLFTGSSIGAMIAAVLAVRIARDHGFRWAFAGTAVAGLAWLPLWLWASRPLLAGANDDGALQTPRIPARELVRHPAMIRTALAIAASAPAITIVLTWFPQVLVETAHVSRDDVGGYLWLPPLAFDLGAVSMGAVASRLDSRHQGATHGGLMLVAGLLTSALALLPLVHSPWSTVGLGSVALAGGGGMYVVATADLMRRVPATAVATVGGLSAAVQSIVQIVVNPSVGHVIDATHSWPLVVIPLGLIALPGAVAWARLPVDPLAKS